MKYVYLLFSVVLFSNCAGNKNFQERPPAQMGNVYFTGQGENTKVIIPITSIQDSNVSLQSLYFHNMYAPISKNKEQPGTYVANFNNAKEDMNMNLDPTKEYGNKVPQKNDKFPYELEDDEAVLVFTQNSKTKFYKITGIQQGS